jgi:hypothetical protein
MQEHPYVDRLEIIKRGASVMKNKKVAAFIRSNDNKDSYKIEYYADGGTLAGSLDVDNIGFGIMAKGGRPIESRFEDKAYVKGNPIGKKAVIPIQMDKNFSFYEYMQNFKKPTGFNVMGIKDGKSVKLNDAPVSKKEADKMYDQAKRNGYSEVQIEGVVFADGGMTNLSKAYVIVKENRDEANDFEGLVFSEEDFSEWLAQKSEEEEEELDEDDYKLIRVSVYKPNKMADGGFVAVSEKDGYWRIITKPTTKEKAQKMLEIGSLLRGEIGKVVTVEEAKEHKKVIGREYLGDGGTLAGSLDVDNIGFGIMAKGGMFKVGDKVSSSMFTEGVIESKKKMGDDTMYFVTYQSSENPNKNNSTVLRESEMTKIRKSKMARGGLAEHGLKKGDTITDDMSWEDSVVVKNEKSGTRAKVNLNTGERKEAKMAKGGKVQYNRRKK